MGGNQVFPMGKRVKINSMHLNLGTLLLKVDELHKVEAQLPEITQKFVNHIGVKHGSIVTFKDIGWGGHGVTWAEVKMGHLD